MTAGIITGNISFDVRVASGQRFVIRNCKLVEPYRDEIGICYQGEITFNDNTTRFVKFCHLTGADKIEIVDEDLPQSDLDRINCI